MTAVAQTIATTDTLSTGDTRMFYPVDTATADLNGVIGSGVTWDYSNLIMLDNSVSKDTVIPISSSTFASDYPNATYQEQFENGIQTFFSNDPANNEVIIHGFVFNSGGSDYIIKYNTDEMIGMQLPMSLNDQILDNISGEANVPVLGTINLTGTANVVADGTGTLILGSNSYSNVIRLKTDESSSGSSPFGPISVQRTSYAYYAQAEGNLPLFIYAEVIVTVPGVGVVTFKMVWSKDTTGNYLGLSQTNEPLTLSIYPNPADNNVTINTTNGTQSIEIYNAVGSRVMSITKPETTENIDVSKLNVGIYFVKIKGDNKTLTKKLVIR